MTEENKNVNNDEQVTVTGEKTGDREEQKTFTQEELNDIVQKRLAKQKENLLKGFQEGVQVSELEEREKEITKRELKADVLETLSGAGLPKDLSKLINYENEEVCKESLELVITVFNSAIDNAVGGILRNHARQETPREGNTGFSKGDPLKNAFGIK